MRHSLFDVWNNSRDLEIESALFTLILVIGATIEYWEELKILAFQTLKVLRFRSLPYEWPVLKKLAFHSLGPILVLVGIAGELVFETRTFIVEDRETAALTREAADAKQSATEAKMASTGALADFQEANRRLGELTAKAGALDRRLEAESANMNNLDRRIAVQGPRLNILSAKKKEFIVGLEPFAGQKFSLMECEPSGILRVETSGVAQQLMSFLGDEGGAGWKLVDFRVWLDVCTQSPGIQVVTSIQANKKVKDAATALVNSLNRLQISAVNWQLLGAQPLPPDRFSALEVLAAREPGVVTIIVGVNPMFDYWRFARPQELLKQTRNSLNGK